MRGGKPKLRFTRCGHNAWRRALGACIMLFTLSGGDTTMSRASQTRSQSFRELFWNLDRRNFPKFAELLAGGRSLGESPMALDGDLRKHAVNALMAVSDACEEHGVRPLIAELAIIADRRMLATGEEYFVSYVGVDSALDQGKGEALEVLREYIDALDLMKADGGEPIVPHRHLYSVGDENNESLVGQGLFVVNEGCLSTDSAPSVGKRHFEAISGLRYGFTPLATPLQRIEDRITYYHSCLLSRLDANATLADSGAVALIKQSSFLVLPFIRPYYQSAALEEPEIDSARARDSGAPGGVLFCFLLPTKARKETGLRRIGRDLQALLSVAGLVESYSSLATTLRRREAEERVNKVLDGVAHTALNTLGAIGSEALCKRFAGDVPPQQLKYALVDKVTGLRDQDLEGELSRALADAFIAEEAARGFLSLGRILASDAEVLHRLCADSDYGLEDEINFALKMVDARSRRGDIRNVDVVTFEGNCQMAAGYLQGRVIRSIIYELLLNSAKHGASPTPESAVPVEIAIVATDVVRVTLRNPVYPVAWSTKGSLALPVTQRRANYLIRLAELFRALMKGAQSTHIGIVTRVEPEPPAMPSHYVAELTLGTLRVMNQDRHPVSWRRPPVAPEGDYP